MTRAEQLRLALKLAQITNLSIASSLLLVEICIHGSIRNFGKEPQHEVVLLMVFSTLITSGFLTTKVSQNLSERQTEALLDITRHVRTLGIGVGVFLVSRAIFSDPKNLLRCSQLFIRLLMSCNVWQQLGEIASVPQRPGR